MSCTSHEDGVLLELIELDHLITKKKIEEVCPWCINICVALNLAPISYPQGEDIKDFINPHSRKMSLAIGEPALRNVQHGTIIQLERKGFFRVDKAFVRAGQVHANAYRRTQTALPSFQLRCFIDDFVLRRCSSSLFRLAGRHKWQLLFFIVAFSPANIVKFTNEIKRCAIAVDVC
jgi:hypothetical protein